MLLASSSHSDELGVKSMNTIVSIGCDRLSVYQRNRESIPGLSGAID